MTSPTLRGQGNRAGAAAVAGAVAAYVMIGRWLDQWSGPTLYVGFADGGLTTLTSVPWLMLTSPLGQAVPVFLGLLLSLWLLPVTGALPLRQVLLRSCVAAAVALAAALVADGVALAWGPIGWFADSGVEIVATRDEFERSALNPWQRLRETVGRMLDLLPAAALGGVLLWAWERRGTARAWT